MQHIYCHLNYVTYSSGDAYQAVGGLYIGENFLKQGCLVVIANIRGVYDSLDTVDIIIGFQTNKLGIRRLRVDLKSCKSNQLIRT